jgi:hypothetical protein
MEVLTSMTMLASIMTTSGGFELAADVFAPNKVFHLERRGVDRGTRVAAALKLLPGRPLLKHQAEVLEELISVITCRFPIILDGSW